MSTSFTTNPLTNPSTINDKQEPIISFSFLAPEDFSLLEPIFTEQSTSLPLPSVSQIAVAIDESTNEIIAFYCFQLTPHAEPMWIDSRFRHTGIWAKLVEMIYPLTERFPTPTYIHATTPETEAMCQRLGLTKVTYPVYVKQKEN